jgi:hypothetical protein
MKKSTILAVPLLALVLAVALQPSAQAAVIASAKKATASLMHTCVRFCGCHHHHHCHNWCDGRRHYHCPGHE